MERFSNKSIELKGIHLLFALILAIRIILVFINPLFTSDLLRNLFFGQHFWEYGFKVYNYTILDIDQYYSVVDPVSGILSWPNNMYDYPVLHLVFFASVVIFPVPVMLCKIVFTLFDIINFCLIRSNKNFEGIAWFYLIISTPFTSLEGQVTSITVFIFLISIYLYESNHQRLGYFFVGIGFQWKIIGIILLPYYLFKDLSKLKDRKSLDYDIQELFIQLLSFFVPFSLLTIVPSLYSGYLLNSMFFNALFIDHNPQNPLYLPGLRISSLLLVLTMGFILFTWISLRSQWREGLDFIPLIQLICFFMLYKLASPWTWLYIFPCLIVIPEKEYLKAKQIQLLLLFTFITASFDFMNLIEGFTRITKVLNSFLVVN